MTRVVATPDGHLNIGLTVASAGMTESLDVVRDSPLKLRNMIEVDQRAGQNEIAECFQADREPAEIVAHANAFIERGTPQAPVSG